MSCLVTDHTPYPLTLLGILLRRILGFTWRLNTKAGLLPEAETPLHSTFAMNRRFDTTTGSARRYHV
jgi:hypothetical protein